MLVCSGCSNRQENTGEPEVSEQNVSSEGGRQEDSETDREADTDVGESSEGAARSIPETLEQIPEGYDAPADQQAGTLKHVIDHAIQDGRMQPMIIVCPTYNHTSPEDSSSDSLALRGTVKFLCGGYVAGGGCGLADASGIWWILYGIGGNLAYFSVLSG